MDLEAFLTTEIYRTLLVFCRLGSALMVMPGFGETQIPTQIRLMLGLVLALAISHAIPGVPVVPPESLSIIIGAILVEVSVGLWIGAVAKILLSCLHLLGHQIAYVSALSNAISGSNAFENGTVFSSLITMAGIAFIFAADIHHIAIEGIVYSYHLVPLGQLPSMSDIAEQGTRAVSESFLMGVRFAAPFLLFGIVVNAGMGLANRMMPTLPVYFVATPLLVGAGIFMLLFTAAGILTVFGDLYSNWLMTFQF